MIFFLFVFFILGSAIGSFLNVVIDRTIRNESILGRSYCEHCKAKLSSIDLIPVISFILLGAKCRYCKKPLSFQYPIVETICGILFALTFYLQVAKLESINQTSLLYGLFLISILIVVVVVDIKYYLIPTTFVLFASLVSLFFNFLIFDTNVFLNHIMAAFGAAGFFLAIVLATFGKGMGEGDIYLAFLIGMVLGISPTILAIFVAFLAGAIISIILLIARKKRFGQTVPFAPFLVLGFLISFYFSAELIGWYLMLY